ncbi:MAG: PEP-CTERM sorting domain-containing protein [Pseudomonadota bacterium]
MNVTGSATGPVNLVLSSYEPTNWILGGDGLSFIDSITINGYHASRVSGFDASGVIDRTGLGHYISACAIAWPNSTGGCDTPTLIAGIESHYGEAVTSFSGAYRATSFSVALSAVPEPSAVCLLGFGLLGAMFQVRRNGSKAISKT